MRPYAKIKSCSEQEFYKIVDISRYMGLNGVGPRVISHNYIDGKGVLEMERLPYSFEGTSKKDVNYTLQDVDRNLFIQHVNAKINLMHALGFAHGDLHISNIVFNKDPFYVYIIDFETTYNITADKHDPEVLDLMETGYEWTGTYDEFVNMDYTHWRNYV